MLLLSGSPLLEQATTPRVQNVLAALAFKECAQPILKFHFLYLLSHKLYMPSCRTSDNAKVYYPNNVLAGKPILNFYRSPDQSDSWEFTILAKTPVEKLGIFKERMLAYVESLPQVFYPKCSLTVREIEDSSKMKMSLGWQHRMNFQVRTGKPKAGRKGRS